MIAMRRHGRGDVVTAMVIGLIVVMAIVGFMLIQAVPDPWLQHAPLQIPGF